MPITRSAALALLLAVPAPSPEVPAPAPEVLARSLCEALHDVPARRRAACCAGTPNSLAEACVQELAPALARGSVGLDPAAVARCAEESAAQFAGCNWVAPVSPPAPRACQGLLIGHLAAGQPCPSSLACLPGLYCEGLSQGSAGVCRPPAAARQRCAAPVDNLAVFTGEKDDPRHPACDGVCVRGVCLARAAEGEACSAPTQCHPGLQCREGQCRAAAAPRIGEACSGRGPCAAGAYCESGTCVALKDAGAACTLAFECRATSCEKAPGAPTGVCGNPCGSARR